VTSNPDFKIAMFSTSNNLTTVYKTELYLKWPTFDNGTRQSYTWNGRLIRSRVWSIEW